MTSPSTLKWLLKNERQKKGRAGDESAGREEVEAVGNHGRHGRARLARVHKQDLLIIFLRLCYGVSCGALSAMPG
jgi:hypothetical protein